MGIKDKVLDILFDEDEEELKKTKKPSNLQQTRKYSTNSLLDTGSIFIDATSPLPKEKKRFDPEIQDTSSYEIEQTNEVSNNKDYRLSENISPIFGPIDNKGKVKKQSILKSKRINDTSIKNFDNLSKGSNSSYTNIVISPIFGPLTIKQNKKVSKPRKKTPDPFERDINDTGSFDTVVNNEEEQIAPNFEEVDEEVTPIIEEKQPLMDTDKLARISDRINQIKNQAANIYDNTVEETEEEVEEPAKEYTPSPEQYIIETEVRTNLSDVIHNLKDDDGQYVQKKTSYQDILPREEIATSNRSVQSNQTVEEPVVSESPIENKPQETSILSSNVNNEANILNNQMSIDDIFDGEEDVEEGKDLFSVLFGDD